MNQLVRLPLIAILIFTIILEPTRLVHAGPREDEILRDSGKVVAKTAATELAKKYLNKSLPSIPGVGGAGTAVLSAVQFGIAVNDFAHADNDKQRTYAGAQAGVAVVAVINPAIGLAAQLALTCVQMLESAMSAGHQKRMLEIFAQIMEHYKRIAEIDTMFAKSELIHYQNSLSIAAKAGRYVTDATDFLKAECSNPANYPTSEHLDGCLNVLVNLVGHQRILIEHLTTLTKSESKFINIEALLEESKISASDIKNQLEKAESTVEINQKAVFDGINVYSKLIAQTLIEKAIRLGQPSESARFAHQCIVDIQNYVLRSATVMIHPPQERNLDYSALIDNIDRAELQREGELIEQRGCDETDAGDPLLAERVKSFQNILETTNARLAYRNQNAELL